MYNMSDALPRIYTCGRSTELALSQKYVLVGSWDGWTSFHELLRISEHGNLFQAAVEVPAGEEIEFQLLCNSDWKLDAPVDHALLTVLWDPLGSGSVKYSLTDVAARPPRCIGKKAG